MESPAADASAISAGIGVRIPPAQPKVTVSGRLWDKRSQVVTPGSYPVTISATDGIPGDGGTGDQPIELMLDSHIIESVPQTCTGACDLSATFWLNTAGLGAGDHYLWALATDKEGTTGGTAWWFTGDPRRTIFGFAPSITATRPLRRPRRWARSGSSFAIRADGEGGYMLGSESPAQALADYKADIADEYGSAVAPAISGMTVGGDIATSALGTIASRVVSRQVATQTYGTGDAGDDLLAENGLFYDDALLAADEAAEGQPNDPRETGAARSGAVTAAATAAKAFAPSYGITNTYNWEGAKRPRRISETLTFSREAIGDVDGDGDKDESPFERAYALDHGYEHDFKLIDDDYTGTGKAPICWDEKERFWAQRKGYTWTTTFPEAAHPYFDDNAGDSCRVLDFTVGVEYPLQLSPGKKYSIRIRTRAGDERFSKYYSNAQKTFRACSGDPKYCSESAGGGAEGQLLIGAQSGARTQECRRWRKGYNSRRTCDLLHRMKRLPAMAGCIVALAGFAFVWVGGPPVEADVCGALPEAAGYHVAAQWWPPGTSRCVVETSAGARGRARTSRGWSG